MTLLYRTAEWHGLAKLRMHTDSSLDLLESLTTEFGLLMQSFQELTCSDFATMELPRETAARKRREAKGTGPSQSTASRDQAAVHPVVESPAPTSTQNSAGMC